MGENAKTVVLIDGVPAADFSLYSGANGNAAPIVINRLTGIAYYYDRTLQAFIAFGGGGSGGHTIEDEGTPLTARASLNFVGAGVTAADSGGKTIVTIPAGGPTGATGPAGAAGPTGAAGMAGQDGAEGLDGDIGQPGPRGNAGTAGAQGSPGAPGVDGDEGQDGLQGPPGATGPQGATGLSIWMFEDPIDPEPLIPGIPGLNGVTGGSGTTTINFGAFPGATDATVTIIGQPGITGGALPRAWIITTATADHSADEHWVDPPEVLAGNVSVGIGFTIYGVVKARSDAATQPGGNFRNVDSPRTYGLWTVAWRY